MAGSWNHVTTRSGRLRDFGMFSKMIENLGDAYEASQECFGMIWWLGRQLAISEGWSEPTREQILLSIRQAQRNYQDGIRLGGRSRNAR